MQQDNTLNKIFKKLTQKLIKNKIDFSIAGAFAVSLYTQPRATIDYIKSWAMKYSLHTEYLEKIRKELKSPEPG